MIILLLGMVIGFFLAFTVLGFLNMCEESEREFDGWEDDLK